ncbi:MAG: serine/threonine protein kinase [Clostridia bacterium]
MMRIGDVLNEKYRVEKFLGRGGTGSVYLCTNIELGNRWAVKHIPAERINSKTMSEIEIMKRLYHISLPRVVDVFRDEQGLYIVESNIEGTGLDRLLQRHGSFAADKVIDWSLELCDILKYLHGVRPKPIIYRDMKPSNIMLTQGSRLVLVDFGISKELCEHQGKDIFLAGTSAYAAPEQLIKGGRTDQRTDIYNLGATMYQLMHGRLARGKNEGLALGKDRAAERVNRIIEKCMENIPEDRYQRVEDIQKELRAVKNMIVVRKTRGRLLFKLELTTVVVLSIVSYVVAVLGFMDIKLK